MTAEVLRDFGKADVQKGSPLRAAFFSWLGDRLAESHHLLITVTSPAPRKRAAWVVRKTNVTSGA